MVALLAALTLLAIALTFAQPELRKHPELRLWTTGSWILVLGLAALAEQAFLPEWLANGLGLVILWEFSHPVPRLVLNEDAPRRHPHLTLAHRGPLAPIAILSLPL